MVHARNKGRNGRALFIRMLGDRDWSADKSYDGIISDDIVVRDPNGKMYSVECKCTRTIDNVNHKKQARVQAKVRGAPWLLASKIYGTTYWLVQFQDRKPSLWKEK